jgi:hypothetical protein
MKDELAPGCLQVSIKRRRMSRKKITQKLISPFQELMDLWPFEYCPRAGDTGG